VDDIFLDDADDEPIDPTPDSVEDDLMKGQPISAKKQGPSRANTDGTPKTENEPIDVDGFQDFEDDIREPSDEAGATPSVPPEEEDDSPRPKKRGLGLPSAQPEVESFLEEHCTSSTDWRNGIIAVAERLPLHASSDDDFDPDDA
jgi:hypothetical protein